jgi:phage tail sheath protein FI
LTYPGVYIQELASPVRPIVGVATSITAFVGRARRGPLNDPIRIQSFADYDRRFGRLWADSLMGFSVRHFFLNGGSEALVVRVHNPSAPGAEDRATLDLAAEDGGAPLLVVASSPGTWGNFLRVIVDHQTSDKAAANPVLFNLMIEERDPDSPDEIVNTEQHRNLSLDPNSPRFVTQVLEQESDLIDVLDPLPAARPEASAVDPVTNRPIPSPLTGGDDGLAIGDAQVAGADLEADKEGLWALEKTDLFNLLCIPPFTADDDVDPATWNTAAAYCQRRRAMLLIDPPSGWNSVDDVGDADILAHVVQRNPNAALYFPRIRAANPLKENRLETFVPCGAVAGVIARIDATRGVWKAPAGQEASLAGVQELAVPLTDGENGLINPLGVNALRTFRVAGRVVWGARTLMGADELASQWKYLPVRRLALFLEESLYRGSQWVVFEPNDEPLWSQIRLNLGAFMHGLFRQGAFQGTTPREAYFVKCDRETTTQNDIDRGIVNIIVGFAPLKPAEFVVIKIQQLAGQVET